MKIDFYLRYYTQPGQSICLSGNWTILGEDDPEKSFPLEYVNSDFWHASLELEAFPVEPLVYHYVLKGPDGILTEEGGNDRVLEAPRRGTGEIQLIDTWNYAGEFENVFFTSPFREVLLHHKSGKKTRPKSGYSHVFRVKAPLLGSGESVCLLGSGGAFHDWNTEDPIVLSREGNWWSAYLTIPPESFPMEYKYGVWNKKEKQFVRYEAGPNRNLPGDARPNKVSILHDGFIHEPNSNWHGAGVSIPVFSLRTRKSMGVGEFTDLKALIDWAAKCGLRMVQILPVHDTTATHTWTDSYPYAAISAFALHPIYLNLEKCAGRKYSDLIKPLKKRQKELNNLPELDYEAVMKIKLLTVTELYELQKEEFKSDPDFLEFFEKNSSWLVPYASFCYLRDKHKTPDFTAWKVHSHYNAAAIHDYTLPGTPHYDAILLQYFIQYHLHLQLRDAVDYAHENGIILKGDIPIGIYRYSCDAWMEPGLYHMDQQAGAPPDNFAVKGQNWGFPTYNWQEMRKDGYAWWKRRFEHMRNYFDAFRIDHILGFFRIWSIPMDVVEGILGHFDPAIPVHRVEFQERNIWFDLERLSRPFINDAVLWEIFGKDGNFVRENFLDPAPGGLYKLRENYSTQRRIEKCFAGR
ncbi:MAG TPA: 4-alpha-glucanotransferase, partial [Puia sp.]|nr:4-alpha-glucanotransferase [Puia sp.]